MHYLGLDLHKETIYGTVLDENDKVIAEGKFPNTTDGIRSFLTGFHPSSIKITMEACGIWRGVYRKLTELGYSVILANPVKTKERSNKKKTDKVDAKTLAELLRTNFLPKVYIPAEDVMRLRDIARHRARLVRFRTQIQAKIKAYLLRDGIAYKRKLWNREGLDWLSSLNDPNITNFLHIYEIMCREIKEVTSRVNNISRNRRITNLLQTIPGVGLFTSLLIVAEIADINRFENPKSLVSYAGLCPGIYQSGQKSHTVMRKEYSHWLKWAVIESSGRAAIMQTKYARHYHRIKARRDWKIARRSTARRMLTDIYYILKNEQPYRAS